MPPIAAATSASAHPATDALGPARLRDLAMPYTFNRFYETATGWLYDYDPGELPTAARDRA